jgi:hypothetical protein
MHKFLESITRTKSGNRVVLLGIEKVLGEAGLDVARLLLARLLARPGHLLPLPSCCGCWSDQS